MFYRCVHTHGICYVCDKCKKILVETQAVVDILIQNDDDLYSIQGKRNFVCCGSEMQVPQLFDSQEEATEAVRYWSEQISLGNPPKIVIIGRKKD